jgi:hypothetical protein
MKKPLALLLLSHGVKETSSGNHAEPESTVFMRCMQDGRFVKSPETAGKTARPDKKQKKMKKGLRGFFLCVL